MSTNKNEVDEKKDHSFRWFIGSILLVVAIWLFNAYIYPLINDSLASRASNGDMFGPTNALFSGLAFAGLIYTIILQRHELALQRESTDESIKELTRQANAQNEQLEALKMQNQLTTLTHDIERSKLRLDLMTKVFSLAQNPKEIQERYAEEITAEHDRIEKSFNKFYGALSTKETK
ncbi:hypothetical protein AAEU29_14995 [Pseudoalteromonas sp. SSM20]|uniref:hypothetical protein n=1 Tax=Pseudoalteromonas sp. SSM20 TaxID=3139394 RepID=UPI003BAA4FCD